MSKSCLCFARSLLAPLSGLSHRWLGTRPGGPGVQPLLALCLLLLMEAAVAAVPTWAAMAPAVGSNCPKIEVNTFPISEEALGIAVGVGSVDLDGGKNTCQCDADLKRNFPVNNANESTNDPTGDNPGYVVSIRGDARQHLDWVGSRVIDATNNDWKQNPCDAHGSLADTSGIDIGNGNAFNICSHSSQACTTTTGKQDPYKEASGSAAGIKKVSAPGATMTATLPLSSSSNVSCTQVSAIGANAAASISTVSPAPNQRHGLRRHLCPPLPLIREAMTLSNRKWRLLATS